MEIVIKYTNFYINTVHSVSIFYISLSKHEYIT